jgi:uncharacterized protein
MPRPRLWYTAIATLFFLAATQLQPLFRLLDVRRFLGFPLAVALRNLLEVGVIVAGVAVAHRFGLRRIATELGLRAPVGRATVFALCASAPMLIAFAVTSPFNSETTLLHVAVFCFVAPFAEEMLFRAFLFGQLYRRARLGFWPSALIPSLIFGAAHMSQSTDPAEIAGIVAITSVGGLGFCWLIVKWDGNVWPAFGLHASMNLWWELFAIDDTALGGWMANGARGATIVLAILLTIYKDRIWKTAPARPADAPASDPPGPPATGSGRVACTA